MHRFKLKSLKTHALASSSILALTFAPHLAMAACSPNPTHAFTTTVCTGVEANGLTVSTNASSVSIGGGASILAPNASTSAVTVDTSSSSSPWWYGGPSITTNGTIDGGSQAGVLVTTSPSTYTATQASITVSSGGVIQGAHGVVVSGDASNPNASYATVTNSGLISGSGGAALYAPNTATGYFSSVNNLVGGRIDGIYGMVNTLTNAGVIDGGSSSAVATLSRYYWQDQVTNSSGGVIRSNAAAATLSLAGWNSNVSNAGVITNSGGGAAIQTTNGLTLTNAGGVINGDIVAGASNYTGGGSIVDNTGGLINGSITLGAGSNRVIADFGTTANPIKNISGAINAGSGTNTLQLNLSSDLTLTSMIGPPATFQKVTYGITSGATLTIAAGANPTSTVYITGSGALVNNATINTTGAAIVPDGANYNGSGVSVTNNGSITATLSGNTSYAISTGFYGLGNVINTGTITAIGGGGVNMNVNYAFTNSGTVTADNTALNAFDSVVTNSGVIHSNQGVGFYGLGNVGMPATNTGVVYGQTIGAQLDGYALTNSGTISSPGLGVAVDPYGSLINLAGGTVNGGVGVMLNGSTFNARVVNFGTINGNVNLGAFPSYYGSNNVFVAQPGSIVNGDVVLGGGYDTFVTSLTNTGSGQFAGVTGTVTGSGTDTVRYIVTGDATATIAAPSLFGNVAYDLSNNAKVTLSGTNLQFQSIGFSGTGSVDLTADLTGSGSTSILDLTQTSMQTTGSPATTVPTVLDVTSHGTLTQTHSGLYTYAAPVVRLYGSSRFTNAGTIIAQDLAPSLYGSRLAGIYGSGTITNTGTIDLTSADGVQGDGNALAVVNSGTIEQVAGGTDSRGIVGAQTVTNSGTISTGGGGVILASGYYGNIPAASLTNSGSITSANDVAVSASGYGSSATIVNQAGGTITGATYGVSISSGSVTNAGTIAGGTDSVMFGNGYYYYGGGPNTLTLQTGSTLIGDAVGSLYGTNALVLQGTGSANNTFLNFNTLDAQGPGTWTLGGTLAIGSTSVSGGTLVVAGALTSTFGIYTGATLQGSTSTLLAQGSVFDNGTLVLDQAADAPFAHAVIGSGALVKQNTGALTLSGFVHLGSTEVASGSLIVTGTLNSAVTIDKGAMLQGNTSSLLAVGAVTDNGTLVFDQATNASFANAITGTGALAKQNTGVLTLSGASSIGSTTVAGGTLIVTGSLNSALNINPGATLQGNASNLQAQGNVNVGGALIFDEAGTGAFANPILGWQLIQLGGHTQPSWLGTLFKQGDGSLTLTGSSAVGATEVAGGSLIVTGSLASALTVDTGASLQGSSQTLLAQGSVTDNGTLVFDQASDGVFANAVTGTGALIKQNIGTLVLNGVSAIATTTVAGGTLQIGDINNPSAQLTSAVTVDAGATLSGHGTIVGNVVNNGGAVAPGGTIGVLTVQGNYTQSADGVLSIEISPTANSVLQVSGTASLAGTLHLVTDGNLFRKGQTYTFVTAGSVSGAFTSVVADNGVQLSVSDPSGVAVATITSGLFAPTGGTPNQNAVGAAVANYPVGVSDFDPVANAVIALPAGARQNAALSQLGGEVDADLLGAGRSSARAVFDSVGEQLFEASLATSAASGPSGWGRVVGRYGSIGADANAHGLTQSAGGVVAGGQIERGGAASFGAAFSYQHTDLSLHGLGQSGRLDTAGLAVYGERRWGAVFLDGAASLAYDHGDSTRHIAFSTISRRADGGFDGYAAGAWASLGVRVVNAHGVRLEPSISLAFSHVEDGGFQESGAAGADLSVKAQALDSVETILGARLSKTFSTPRGALTLEARAAGVEELRDPAAQAGERFAAAPGTDFTVTGADSGRSAGLVGAGITYAASSRVTLFGHYDGRFGSHQSDQAFSLGGKIAW